MALQDILDQILQQAQEEVQTIEKKFESTKREIKKESEQNFEVSKTELHTKTLERKEHLEEKMKSLARSKRSSLLLQAQREVVNEYLNLFVAHLKHLKGEPAQKIIALLLSKIDQNSAGEIWASADQVGFITEQAPKSFTVQSDPSISGGFRLKTKNGESDHTFETLVHSEFKSEIEIFLAKQLNFI